MNDARPVILVVDDEPGVLDFLVRLLDIKGFSTQGAGDGKEAVAIARERGEEIDLVLLDLQLQPSFSGPSTHAGLVKLRPDVPVLLMSGDLTVLEDLGLQDVPAIAKPFTPDQLVARIREVLA